MTRVMAVDPGGSTGFAFYDNHLDEGDIWGAGSELEYYVTATEKGLLESARYIAACFDHFQPNVVVCESFTITMNTLKKTRDGNTAIELIGITRYLADRNGAEFKLQSPSEKEWTTNHKMERLGWQCKRTPDHEWSATKHLIRHLVLTGLVHPSRVV